MREKLVEKAIKAKENSYSPYSGFRVGACVLTDKGNKYTGCNVENVSYGLTLCAERVAIFKAVSEGELGLSLLGVSTDSSEFIIPCGACLQVMAEFCNDLEIILINNGGDSKSRKLQELLPRAFKF